MGCSRSKIVDADNPSRAIAFTEGQGAKIGTVSEGLGRCLGIPPRSSTRPTYRPLWHAFGAFRRDNGHWALPELTVEPASRDAALHIGPRHALFETAAIDCVASQVGTDRLQMQAWHVMFLVRDKIGPSGWRARPCVVPATSSVFGSPFTTKATTTAK
jgi:hypothetical protein